MSKFQSVPRRKGIIVTALIAVFGCVIIGVSAPIWETFLGATLILIGVCLIGVGGVFFNYFMYMHSEVEGQKQNKKEKIRMKMSKKKTEVAVALLFLLACIMLYGGVRVSALVPACGLWILMGIVYWEKRRAENRYKNEKANG